MKNTIRILAFADLHGNRSALKRVIERCETYRPEALVAAGDLTIFENSLSSILFNLSMLKLPVIIIPGNHEGAPELRAACSHFSNLKFVHSGSFVLGKACFIGYGGGGFSVIDKNFEAVSKSLEKHLRGAEKTIFTTHAPPHGTMLDLVDGEHHGNKSFTEFIIKNQPDLVVCGHLHENKGKMDYIGRTKVVNPGPEGIIIEV